MRRARVYVQGVLAGLLEEHTRGSSYRFAYQKGYAGPPVSLTMPASQVEFWYEQFPPFFDGVLPEGLMLDGLLRRYKIDKRDYFSQLLAVGKDLVGAVTVEEFTE